MPAVTREQVGAALEGGPEVQRSVTSTRRADHVAEFGPDDRRPAAILDQSRGNQPDDPDRPRPTHDRRAPSTGRHRPLQPGPPSTADFIRSRRVRLAASSASAWTGGLGGVLREQEVRRLDRLPHPPGRIESRGEGERDRLEVDRRRRSIRARSSSAAIPGRGAGRIRSSPSRAMARFSPTIGATSATVPIVARSARSSAAAGPPGSSARTSCAILNATPLPARRRSG